MFLTGKRAGTLVATLALVVLLCAAGGAQAVPVSIKLTSDALGLGNSDINKGKTVAPDVPGFITSPTAEQGSILTVQSDGKAGIGTTVPVLVTITAQTRLDVTEDLPQWPNDYHAGIIFTPKKNTKRRERRSQTNQVLQRSKAASTFPAGPATTRTIGVNQTAPRMSTRR